MSVIAIVLELLRLGLPVAQEIVAGANLAMAISGRTPTEDEARQLDKALFAAHEALQAATQAPAAEA